MPRFHQILLLLIIVLAIFLRFYSLSTVPNGLEQDETSIGYNAYSVLMTGKGEHAEEFPLYFKAFGEYKLPGYIYASILPIFMFGLSEFSVRLPAAVSGVLSVVMMYVIVRQLLPKEKFIALSAALVLSIAPWHLHFSRGAFEVSMALFCILLGTSLYLLSVKRSSIVVLIMSILAFGLSMYTYNIARMFSPALLLLLFYLFPNKALYQGLSKKIVLGGAVLFLMLPFVLSLTSQGGVSAAQGTLISSSAVVQAELLELRGYYLYLPQLFTKLFFNQIVLTGWQYLQNIGSYASVDFFFINGSAHGNHGIGNVGQFYLFMLPLFFLGLINLFKEHRREALLFFGWSISVILIASLTREAPHGTRGFFLVVPFSVFIGYGALSLIEFVRKSRNRIIRYGVFGIFCVFAFYNIVYYFTSYYTRFPVLYAPSFRSEDRALSEYLKENEHKYDRIVIDNTAGLVYISLLFYMQYSPELFHQTVVRAPDDSEGFSNVTSFGKYQFMPIDWEKDTKRERTLLITTPYNTPRNVPVLKTLYYPVRPVASALGQEIVSYPVEDIAYVIVETP